jgi:hypothetical protein
MSEFSKLSLQQLVGECRRLSERHPDREVRKNAENLFNEYLVAITQPSTAEELALPHEELRLRLLEFVNTFHVRPS